MAENQTQTPPPIEPPPPATPAGSSPPPPSSPESQARMWNMLCHLSALAGFVIPFGNILGPLIVWQIKKNEFPSVDIHGKAALNFQITVIIAVLAAIFAGFVLMIIGIGILLLFGALAIHFCGIIFAIIAGIKANNGEDYKYPYSFEFVK